MEYFDGYPQYSSTIKNLLAEPGVIFFGVHVSKYVFVFFLLISGCASTANESTVNKFTANESIAPTVMEDFVPSVWVERNNKTGQYYLNINTRSKAKVTILSSKSNITNPVVTRDGELLAYISDENQKNPIITRDGELLAYISDENQ